MNEKAHKLGIHCSPCVTYAVGIAADWEEWQMDRWAYISDLVPKKDKED